MLLLLWAQICFSHTRLLSQGVYDYRSSCAFILLRPLVVCIPIGVDVCHDSHSVYKCLMFSCHLKIASAPEGTQAASLDIEHAYHNSPIIPQHKPYLAMSWNDSIYVGHVAMEGLVTAGGIQGNAADALLDILRHHGIPHVFKWVDDVVIFRHPVHSFTSVVGTPEFAYGFDLDSIFDITTPLGVPWHPIETKGQDFSSSVKYVGFLWDLERHHVSLPEKKQVKILAKINSFLASSILTVTCQDSASLHGSLQHITFIFREGCSTLPPLSSFILKFPNHFAR